MFRPNIRYSVTSCFGSTLDDINVLGNITAARATTIDSKVYLSGGHKDAAGSDFYQSIHGFDPEPNGGRGKWSKVPNVRLNGNLGVSAKIVYVPQLADEC